MRPLNLGKKFFIAAIDGSSMEKHAPSNQDIIDFENDSRYVIRNREAGQIRKALIIAYVFCI